MNFAAKVVLGNRVAEHFAVPTANLELENLPKIRAGVYFCLARIAKKRVEKNAVLHIGSRPTFGQKFTAECHLLDFSGDLYGEILEIELLKFHRPTQKFQNSDELFTQIETDLKKAKKFFFRRKIAEKWQKISRVDLEKMANFAVSVIGSRQDFQKTKTILAFASMQSEIPFIEKLMQKFPEKSWHFPKIIDQKIEFFKVEKFSDLSPGKFKILEPKNCKKWVFGDEKTMIFVPALAVDRKKNRLGRGHGFFDKFLATLDPKIEKIAVLPRFSVFGKIPVEPHDQKIDKIVEI